MNKLWMRAWRACVLSACAALFVSANAFAQTVTLQDGTVVTAAIFNEVRNLDDPPPAPVVYNGAQQAQDYVAFYNPLLAAAETSTRTCGRWRADGASLVYDGSVGDHLFNNPCDQGYVSPGTHTETWLADISYVTRDIVIVAIIDNSDGSTDVELRALFPDMPSITINAADLASAQRLALTNARAASGRRYYLATPVLTGGGPLAVSDRVLSSRLTGYDTYFAIGPLIISGADGPRIVIGSLGDCPTAASMVGCAGGYSLPVYGDRTGLVLYTFTTYYVTDSVERTLTGGTSFYDAQATALPTGVAHASAVQAGFMLGDRFLRRLTDNPSEARVGSGAIWSEAWTSQSDFDAGYARGAVGIESQGFDLGVVVRPSEHWTIGLAAEYGQSDVGVADALTPESADVEHIEAGLHAAFRNGPFSASAAAIIGGFDVETYGGSVLGAARASYTADVAGVSLEAGYDVPVGALVLRPHVGASNLNWTADGFSETGGPAPLTVASADEAQTRVWAGLQARWTPQLREGRLTVSSYARWVSISGDSAPALATFDPQLPGEAFLVAAPDLGDDVAEYGVGVDYRVADRVRIEAAYDGRSGDGFSQDAGRLTLHVAF